MRSRSEKTQWLRGRGGGRCTAGRCGQVAQLAVQQNEYERAKENDELEEAIHIKKVTLPRHFLDTS